MAVASRTQEKAEAYAREKKIPHAFGSYEALLADREIDAVYIPLPNHLHAEWTIKAVKAGKHVLCEKPLALSLDEVDAIASAAEDHGRAVAEAFMYRTHPQILKVKEIVDSGKLGRIKAVHGSFTYMMEDPDDIRLRPEMGGGSMWDIGCYPLSYTRSVLGTEPQEVFGWQVLGPSGVDETFMAQLRFPEDVLVQFDCSFRIPYHTFMEIVGEAGTLVIPHPFTPKTGETIYLTRNQKTETIPVKGADTYIGEVEDLADTILLGKPPVVSLADSRLNITAILALLESAKSGKPVSI
jgi:predicted dehydrogenase